MACTNCGYCEHCGRSNTRQGTPPPVDAVGAQYVPKPLDPHTAPWRPKPLPEKPWPPSPWPGIAGSWQCECGVWVGSHQVHTCPRRPGIPWNDKGIPWTSSEPVQRDTFPVVE